MKQSRRQLDNFESQLEQKLNKLSQVRSNKKLKYKPPLMGHKKNQLDLYSNIDYNMQENQQQADQISGHLPSGISSNSNNKSVRSNDYRQANQNRNSENSQQRLNIDRDQKKKEENSNPLLDLVTNKQIHTFLSNISINHHTNLDLSYFLAKCLAIYSNQPELPQQQIKTIFLQLQQEITTTDPNKVSVNALELAVKKVYNSLALYISDKILKAKYEIQYRKLKQKNKQLDRLIEENKEYKKSKQKEKLTITKNMQQKQKQLGKRQKNIGVKQKQLMQRIKNHKKMLEQSAEKLTQKYAEKLSQIVQKVEKKINTYERNMKYRVQDLHKKTNKIQQLRQLKQEQIRKKVIKQLEQKYKSTQNNKIKKYENEMKQLYDKLQHMRKSFKQSEQQNNKLMKIYSKLENKYHKQSAHFKELLLQLESKNVEIKQLQYLCHNQTEHNEQLMQKIIGNVDHEQKKRKNNKQQQVHERQKDLEQSEQKQKNKLSTVKSKKSLNNATKENKKVTQKKTKIQIEYVVQCYQQIIGEKLENMQGNVINNMTLLSTKLLLNEYQCRITICFLFDYIMSRCADVVGSSTSAKLSTKQINSRVRITMKKLQQHFYPESAEHLLKYFRNLKARKHNEYECIWKLQIVYLLLANREQSQVWTKQIQQGTQIQQIQQQMQKQIGNKQYNFVLSIVTKMLYEKHAPNIQILVILTDIMLNFQINLNNAYLVYIGQLFVKDFMHLAKISIENEKYYSQHYESIEKISILVQRLIVANNIHIKMQYQSTLIKLIQNNKCKGTLLLKNISSILQAIENKQKDSKFDNILGQIYDD